MSTLKIGVAISFKVGSIQRCSVHFYRNVFSVTPRSKVKPVTKMHRAIHAQESRKAAPEKAKVIVKELHFMKLKESTKKEEDGIEEPLAYYDSPSKYWTRFRTNNAFKQPNQEIHRRTRVMGSSLGENPRSHC